MQFLDRLKRYFNVNSADEAQDRHIAVGSEALHDAGLTDQETSDVKLHTKARRDVFTAHNEQRPEEKIRSKQKFKTPV